MQYGVLKKFAGAVNGVRFAARANLCYKESFRKEMGYAILGGL